MNKINLTLKEAVRLLKENGYVVSEQNLANGIESGLYPFGKSSRNGTSSRRTFIIFQKDVRSWIKEHTCEEVPS